MDKEMLLPEGKTCSDCVHFDRCSSLYAAYPRRKDCDFYPIRFQEIIYHEEDNKIEK